MFLELIARFRQWAQAHQLIVKPTDQPVVVVFWPDNKTWMEAVLAMRRDEQLADLCLHPNEGLLNQPTIEGIPVQTWVINGIPVIHTTTQGDLLVAARPAVWSRHG